MNKINYLVVKRFLRILLRNGNQAGYDDLLLAVLFSEFPIF